MKVDVVADVGNTRIKWGRCTSAGVTAVASLPPDDPAAWQKQLTAWELTGTFNWAIAGVHPQRSNLLGNWLHERGDSAWRIDRAVDLPLKVNVPQPQKVGIDRLLDAVAAVKDRSRGRVPAAIVDAGSAITVDWVDDQGVFRGGAILPGLGLMAKALHDYTALLPLIAVRELRDPPPVGQSTEQAIAAGVYHAAVGGVNRLLELLSSPHVFLTGGDAPLLERALSPSPVIWPEMTLEGIRLTAEAQP
ncbi:MAG: type III pantothenate kinase [Gemmataceae bacterium]|nr:type III pantothenate kinase [Gemmataceae bacterium]